MSYRAAFPLLLIFSACAPKLYRGECKATADCVQRPGFGHVCVSGVCAECAADADCAAGFGCQSNRCFPVESASPAYEMPAPAHPPVAYAPAPAPREAEVAVAPPPAPRPAACPVRREVVQENVVCPVQNVTTYNCASPPCPGPPPPPPPDPWWKNPVTVVLSALSGALGIIATAFANKYAASIKKNGKKR